MGSRDFQAFSVSVRIEERESKLPGLDSASQLNVMMGAPAKVSTEVRSRTGAIERLFIDEQTAVLSLRLLKFLACPERYERPTQRFRRLRS